MARRAAGIKIDISANVARLSADMTKAVGILGGFERQANAISRNLRLAFGGAIFAGLAVGLKSLSSTIFELAEAGDKAGDIQSAFEKLGGSASAIEKASQATQGLIDKFDLMKAANDAMIKGLPNVNQNFSQLADLATRVASARDLNPFETLQNLISAISSGKASSLKEFAINIGEVKSKAEGTATALNLVPEALQKFDPVVLGVSDSVAAFKIRLDEIYKNIGIGVDSSYQLAGAFASFRAEADPELMQKFGLAIANVEAVIVSLATSALPVGIRLLEDFALGIDHLFGITSQGKNLKALTRLDEDIKRARDEFKQYQEMYNNPDLFIRTVTTQEQRGKDWDESSKRLIELERQREQLLNSIGEQTTKAKEEQEQRRLANVEQYLKRESELRKKFGFDSNTGKYTVPDTKDASKIQKLYSDFAKLTARDLKSEIETAIQAVDVNGFENLKVELYAATRDSFLEANKELVEARVATEEQVTRLAEKNAIETVEGYEARMHEAYDRLGEQLKQQHETAVQSWSGFVDNLFNFDQFDPKTALKDLAKGFLSEVLGGLAGELGQNAQSFYGLGRVIAQGFSDSTQQIFNNAPTQPTGAQSSGSGWGSILQGIGSIFGSQAGGLSFTGTAQNAAQNAEWNAAAMGGQSLGAESAGASGAGLSAAQAGGIVAAIQTISAGLSAGGMDRQNSNNAGTGGAVGAGAGGILGAIFGGPAGAVMGSQLGMTFGSLIGSLFKWGPQNPQTQARHAFANFVEEGFQKLKTVSFFDAQRRLQTMSSQNFNFLEGPSTRFNEMGDNGTDWAENFRAMGDQAVTVFSGLGEAMEEILGLTEDVGSQIGYLLATNLSGNVDNARLLVQQLGLELSKLEEALVEAGRTGEMTWLEVEVALQGVNEAFGEGLVAVGDVAGAFEELVGSGGRGVAALKGVRDLAVEALEAGGRTLDDLRNRLLAAGKAPEVVDALIGAIRNRGVGDLEALRGANDRTLGGIVADTNAHSETIRQQWEAMDGKIKGFQQTLSELDSQMTKDLTINIKTNFDGNTQQALDQGVFTGTGAERITTSAPMETPNTKAAQFRRSVPTEGRTQAASINVNVDARGAERGVHSDVISAMATMERRIMNRTADLVYQQARG